MIREHVFRANRLIIFSTRIFDKIIIILYLPGLRYHGLVPGIFVVLQFGLIGGTNLFIFQKLLF